MEQGIGRSEERKGGSKLLNVKGQDLFWQTCDRPASFTLDLSKVNGSDLPVTSLRVADQLPNAAEPAQGILNAEEVFHQRSVTKPPSKCP